MITQPVQIIGVRPEERAKTGDFAEFLFDDQIETDRAVVRGPEQAPGRKRRPVNS